MHLKAKPIFTEDAATTRKTQRIPDVFFWGAVLKASGQMCRNRPELPPSSLQFWNLFSSSDVMGTVPDAIFQPPKNL